MASIGSTSSEVFTLEGSGIKGTSSKLKIGWGGLQEDIVNKITLATEKVFFRK
jgi:hypothetical protein